MTRILKIEFCFQCCHGIWSTGNGYRFCNRTPDPDGKYTHRAIEGADRAPIPTWCPLPDASQPSNAADELYCPFCQMIYDGGLSCPRCQSKILARR